MTITRRSALELGAGLLAGTGLMPALVQTALAAMDKHGTLDTDAGTLDIYPVRHASLVLGFDGKAVYADPVGGAALYEGMPPPDLILITHEHSDHFDLPTLKALVTDDTHLITNPSVYDKLSDALKSKAERLSNGEATQWGDISIDAVPAFNTTGERKQYHPLGRDNGYVLNMGGSLVYIAGDTEDTPVMRGLSDIELAFIPMNLPYTMDVEQAADAVLGFAPKVVYPYHYRGSDTEKFKQLVDDGGKDIEVRLVDWYS